MSERLYFSFFLIMLNSYKTLKIEKKLQNVFEIVNSMQDGKNVRKEKLTVDSNVILNTKILQ